MYDRRDPYYRKAKEKGYRARSSYKLKQIQKKFRVIRPSDLVIDLGAAPGGWTQVAAEAVGKNGFVIAVDKLPIRSFQQENVVTMQINMESPKLMHYINDELQRKADVVLSDLAGNVTGQWHMDTERQLFLASLAFETATNLLRDGGNFVTKVFRGPGLENFLEKLKPNFTSIKHWRPPATRKTSAEEYVICRGYKHE